MTNGDEVQEGSLGRRVAHGTAVQQAGVAAGLIVALVTTTALGRSLTLAEFGVYGVVVSLAMYVTFAVGSAETAAVKLIAAAVDQQGRDRAYTTSLAVYCGLGLVAAVVIGGIGQLLLLAFDIDAALEHQARLGVVAVGLATAVGFPLRLHVDLLRASHRFALAGLSEAIGWGLLGALQLLLLYALDAPLWTIAGVGGANMAFLGGVGLLMVRAVRLPYHARRSELHRADVVAFLRETAAILAIASSDLVISSLDRTILALFRPVATVGLYEAAVRVNNLVRTFTGSLSVTILPITSRLAAVGDRSRERELMIRGTRYMLAAVVPPTVALMVLADLLLAAWLGPEFSAAGGGAAIFLVWWLLSPNSSIAGAQLVVESQYRRLLGYSWTIAAVNLTVSLALTPVIGLEGVAIGTTVGYLSTFPFFLRYALTRHDLTVGEFARRVWWPTYGTGALVAAGLWLVRSTVALDGIVPVLSALAGATVAGWALFFLIAMDAEERAVFRGFLKRA